MIADKVFQRVASLATLLAILSIQPLAAAESLGDVVNCSRSFSEGRDISSLEEGAAMLGDDLYPRNRGYECSLVSDIIGKMKSRLRLRDDPITALYDLIKCMEDKGMYTPGEGTNFGHAGRRALCDCQKKMVHKTIQCRWSFRASYKDVCNQIKRDLAKGGMAIATFCGPFGCHDIAVTDAQCPGDMSSSDHGGIIGIDPDTGNTITVVIDANNDRGTSSNAGSPVNGGTFSGSYSVSPG